MPELKGLPDHAPDSFVSLFARNDLPDWFTEISSQDTPLRLFAVAP
jgi:hypothetical protein